MKISYVLPVYNSQNTIAQCLKSLLKQNVKPHEIIIINDASTDNTQGIIQSVHDERVKYIFSSERKGAAWCRNQGNKMASGDIIAVCDADWYYPNRSNAIIEFFKTNKDKGLFYSGLELRDAKFPQLIDYMGAYEWDFNSKCPISHPTVAYRKQLAKEIKYHEDSIETDLYEFFLLDANKKGYLFGGSQEAFMVKVEGNATRDKTKAWELKRKKYEEYGIKI